MKSRRDFLKMFGVGAAATAVAATPVVAKALTEEKPIKGTKKLAEELKKAGDGPIEKIITADDHAGVAGTFPNNLVGYEAGKNIKPQVDPPPENVALDTISLRGVPIEWGPNMVSGAGPQDPSTYTVTGSTRNPYYDAAVSVEPSINDLMDTAAKSICEPGFRVTAFVKCVDRPHAYQAFVDYRSAEGWFYTYSIMLDSCHIAYESRYSICQMVAMEVREGIESIKHLYAKEKDFCARAYSALQRVYQGPKAHFAIKPVSSPDHIQTRLEVTVTFLNEAVDHAFKFEILSGEVPHDAELTRIVLDRLNERMGPLDLDLQTEPPRWRNYTFQYTDKDRDEMEDAMRKALAKTKFNPPVEEHDG